MRKLILDIPIDWVSQEELIRKLKLFVVSQKAHHITTVNPEFIVVSRNNKAFRTVLQNADLSLADGTGIVLAQTFFDQIKSSNISMRWISYIATGLSYLLMPQSFTYHRITGVALTEIVMQLSAQEGWRVFLLGAMPGVGEQAKKIWEDRYPGLIICGTSAAHPTESNLIAEIRDTKPHVLVVAYGTPKQELFLGEKKHELKIPIMVGVGGTFDTLVGRRYRPPQWIKSLGLEWLTFLFRHPGRFSRIWRSTLTFSRIIVRTPNQE